MAELILQNNQTVPIPEGQFFRTANTNDYGTGPADFIYQRTPEGIKAYNIRVQPDPSKPATYAIPFDQYAKLPQFNAGIVTDIERALGRSGSIQAQQITPDVIGQLSAPPVALGNLAQQPLDVETANLVKAGGAGIGGFQAGGQAGINAGLALQTRPEAVQNRLSGIMTSSVPQPSLGNSSNPPLPAPSVQPPTVSGVASLYSNATIASLEKKIKEQSEALSAGISIGGSTQILSELFDKFGIKEEQNLVNQYSANILEQQQRLRKLPDDIKRTLEDVGVNESQLNRLIVKETQKPLETLRDLMEQRGAATDRINQALRFVGIFADAAMQDRAAKIEAAKLELEMNKDLLTRLDKQQQEFMKLALDEKADILTMANTAMERGASKAIVDSILASGDSSSALSVLASSGFGVEKKYETTKIGDDVYQYQIDANGKMVGTPTKIISAGGGGVSALTTAQINSTVNQIAQSFDNEPIVRNFNTINETVNFVKTAGNLPTDDISRIYAFAKVMDPNSAVREGEYKTVQEYSTALLQRVGLNAKRVFTNTGFLTDEARKFINTTLSSRLESSRQNYQNVKKEYDRRIEDAKQGKLNSITDYSKAFSPQNETQALNALITYKQIHPEKIGELDNLVSSVEKALGRPINALEFLQAYPEYQ